MIPAPDVEADTVTARARRGSIGYRTLQEWFEYKQSNEVEADKEVD